MLKSRIYALCALSVSCIIMSNVFAQDIIVANGMVQVEEAIPSPTTNTAVDYSQPITAAIQNNAPVDLTPIVMIQENISPEDVSRLVNTTLYAHSERTFLFNRTGYPAQLVVVFRVAFTETGYRGYTIAKWEYMENQAQSFTCHTAEGLKPYFVGCTGNDNIITPSVEFSIGFQTPPQDVSRYPLPSP